MKFTRKAKANWQGSGKEGKGLLSTESTVLDETQYSFNSRFEDGKGTNPEELIAAAHSGCFTMQLSVLLDEEGFSDKELSTDAKLTFEDGKVSQIQLSLVANVKGIEEEKFIKIADKAKEICPISKLLNTQISLSSKLVAE